MDFLESSNVNLGRRDTDTRRKFLATARTKLNCFGTHNSSEPNKAATVPLDPMDDRILRIKPTDPNKALDMGKGVHAMTPTESMRADIQLRRSPFGKNDE